MSKVKRIPRPKGATEINQALKALSNHQNKEPNKQEESFKDINIEELQSRYTKHIVNHYINTGYTYCHQPMNIEQFSQYTNIDPETIYSEIMDTGNNQFNILQKEAQQGFLRAIIFGSLKNALTDRSRALQQYNTLLASQGNRYLPFVSGEVNKALKLVMESGTEMLNIYKALAGTQGLKVLEPEDHRNKAHENYLTTEKAIEIMGTQDALPLNKDEMALDSLEERYLNGTPVVQATEQQGIDTSKEGLDFDSIAQISDSLLPLEPTEKKASKHENRRAREIGEDLEADHI